MLKTQSHRPLPVVAPLSTPKQTEALVETKEPSKLSQQLQTNGFEEKKDTRLLSQQVVPATTKQVAPESGLSLTRMMIQEARPTDSVTPQLEKPALKPLTIKGSVGADGVNDPADVKQVREALQAVGYLPAGEAKGTVDKELTQAIAKYQKDNNLPVVDGRIDVSKYTMNHLNQRATGNVAPNVQTGQVGQTGEVGNLGSLLDFPAPSGVTGIAPPTDGPLDAQLADLQRRSIESARREWQMGSREDLGSNRGSRVDQYARSVGMRPGQEWCGFFTGFNYKQSGFKHGANLASFQKARDYFMYRQFTSGTGSAKNQELDQVRQQHQATGNSRQYFMLEESGNRNWVTRDGSWGRNRYGHYDADANTFNYQNLPIRSGDTALFGRGHVGMVDSYNPATGQLVTLEGNTSGEGADGRRRHQAVVRKVYDLTDPSVRAQFDGFGRPSIHDFQ